MITPRDGDTVRFLHTADWQLGMTRRFLGDESQAVFTADRLAAVAALGELATEHGAQFIVVAGDAFEDNAVPRSVVLRAAEVLAGFPVPVLILPGNHDPLDVSSVLRCRDFVSAVSDGPVVVLDGSGPVEVLPGVEVVGVPWTSKRPDPSRLPALVASLEPTDALRVLVAHGGTDEVYGGDSPSVEAIAVSALEGAVDSGRLDYVALGDRHSVTRVGSGERIWFSGAPETTDFDDVEKNSGHVLLVELDRVAAGGGRGQSTVTPLRTGRWSFLAVNARIDTDEDLLALTERIEAIEDKPRTVLKLGLTGTVGVALRARIDEELERWAALFACAYLRETRTHLVVRADDTDLTDLVDGYAGRAVADLMELAAAGGPEAEDAGNALSLLYRLVDGGGPVILHRLILEDFRGVVREEVEVPQRGVLVIEGPNESGKTSLMDALEMLLEYKASSGRADIKAASPVGRDVPVVVEAEFTIDDQRMRYRKEFVRGKRTSLEFPGSARQALTGDDAHDHVRDLVERKVDRSLWRALRIAQDEPIGQVNAAKGMDSLRRALDAAAGGEDPTGDDNLISRVSEERDRYLTAKRGEPTGDLARSESRVTEARSALSSAKAGHAELDAAVDDHAAQAAVHKAHTESLSTVEAEVTRLEAAGLVVAERRQVCSEADTEVDRAAAENDAALRATRERAALVDEVERESGRVETLRTAATEAAERLAPAEQRAEKARASLEAAEAALTDARARLDEARVARENDHRRRELARLDTLVGTLGSVGDQLAATEAELGEVAVSDDAVERVRTADEALREAAVRSAVSAPTVEIAGSGELTVAGEPRDAAPGWSQHIVEDTVFEVGTVSLTVVPAGHTDEVRRAEMAARERLEAALAEIGVQTREQAEERSRRSVALRAEIEALRRRRTDLLGEDTLEDLIGRRDALREQLPEEITPRDAGEAVEDDHVAGDAADGSLTDGLDAVDPTTAAASAEKVLAERRAEDRIAATEAETARTDHATRTALLTEAESRLEERVGALEAARAAVPDLELSATEERTRARLEKARESARKARALLDDALAEAPPELLDNARASLAALRAEERDSSAAVATALGRVNAIGDQGRLADVSAAERELDEAERENTALWRRARAADLLYRTLTARRSEALRAYQEPFHRAVVDLGSLVYGRDFDVRLGDDLTILSRRIGDVTVDYDSLSGGAREQLAVIVRIACARLVGTGGVPVFLDDTMGYTDPTRRMTMGAVIAAAAATSQVIVLTCDRARFAGIGGARTHVMRRTATPVE